MMRSYAVMYSAAAAAADDDDDITLMLIDITINVFHVHVFHHKLFIAFHHCVLIPLGSSSLISLFCYSACCS